MSKALHHCLAIGTLVLLGVLIYFQTLQYSFHFDDYYFITENLRIRDIHNIRDIWHSLAKPSRFIGMFSFALNYHFHQLDVFGYHLVNICIHIFNGLLVWWFALLTLRIGPSEVKWPRLIAFFSAALFIVHPMNTQAVTYICQRFASLATLFYMLSFCLYIQGRTVSGRGGKGILFAGSFMSAVLGMFTKQIVLTLPVMIILYECCIFKRSLKWNRTNAVGAVILLAMFLIIPTLHQWNFARLFDVAISSRSHDGDIITSQSYMFTQFRVIPTYIRLMFVPIYQTLDYDFSVSNSLFELKVILGMLFIFGIMALAVRNLKRKAIICFGVLWFFITMGLESTFIPIYQVIFEHRCYLPSVGFLLAITLLLSTVLKDQKKFIVLMSVVVLTLSVLAYQRNQVWENETTLWMDIKKKAPKKIRPYIHLGVAYIMKGDYDQALDELNQAEQITQDNYKVYHNRGIAFEMKGQLKKALKDYSKAVELNERSYVSLANRGGIYLRQKQFSLAMADLNLSIELNPDYASSYLNRGNVFYQTGQYQKALNDFLRARELGSPIRDEEIIKVKKLIK